MKNKLLCLMITLGLMALMSVSVLASTNSGVPVTSDFSVTPVDSKGNAIASNNSIEITVINNSVLARGSGRPQNILQIYMVDEATGFENIIELCADTIAMFDSMYIPARNVSGRIYDAVLIQTRRDTSDSESLINSRMASMPSQVFWSEIRRFHELDWIPWSVQGQTSLQGNIGGRFTVANYRGFVPTVRRSQFLTEVTVTYEGFIPLVEMISWG